jgi:hypothetical protein
MIQFEGASRLMTGLRFLLLVHSLFGFLFAVESGFAYKRGACELI